MRQTIVAIPSKLWGVDLFGFGWLLALWAVATVSIVGWSLYRRGWRAETRSQLTALLVIGAAIAFVLPMLMKPEGLLIRGYGLMLLVAVLSGVGLSVYRAHRKGVDPEIILSLSTWLFISGIVGARLFFVIEYWEEYKRPTLWQSLAAILNLTEGGLVVFGSMLAGGAALIVFIYKHKLPGLALADLIAPGVVLGVAIGRIGCFLNGCCFGSTCDLPWAVQFPAGTPAYIDQAQRGEIFIHGMKFRGSPVDPAVVTEVEPRSAAERGGVRVGDRIVAVGGVPTSSVREAKRELLLRYEPGEQVSLKVAGDSLARAWTIEGPKALARPAHPTQLYSFIDALLLCLFLLAYEPYQRRDGELTALVLTIHPVMRFLLEIIRTDEAPVFHTGLSISQNISIALFVAGIALWIYVLRRPEGLRWGGSAAVAAMS
jgi:phosphatidylglycerol:prolipoprotein diacylglycerol transferase